MAALAAAGVCRDHAAAAAHSLAASEVILRRIRATSAAAAVRSGPARFVCGSGRAERRSGLPQRRFIARSSARSEASVEQHEEEEQQQQQDAGTTERVASGTVPAPEIAKELNKAVSKTAATFAPRASTASKNPAVPGSTLYQIFETQAYISMVVGGALSFNLLFPSDHADIWRLMGMWSIWMFTIPSLRARDCSKKEKEALNYLFLVVPLINVTLPIFWKSFSAVWAADVVAFFAMYAWKMDWLTNADKTES